MKTLAWFAIALSLMSMAVSIGVVAQSPEALRQLRALDFPLTGIGETAMAMYLPIFLSTVGCAGILAVRQRLGRVAVVLVALSWLVLWGVLGSDGFYYLF